MLKKMLLIMTVLLLTISTNSVRAEEVDSYSENDGNENIVIPENKIITDDDYVTINDYQGIISEDLGLVPSIQSRIAWKLVGIAIITFVGSVVSACSNIQYISGHDVCRTVIRYIVNPPKIRVTYKYNLNARYVRGYIPGCQSQHSSPCNSGYWQYRVAKI